MHIGGRGKEQAFDHNVTTVCPSEYASQEPQEEGTEGYTVNEDIDCSPKSKNVMLQNQRSSNKVRIESQFFLCSLLRNHVGSNFHILSDPRRL
jgi:hypothetical protein